MKNVLYACLSAAVLVLTCGTRGAENSTVPSCCQKVQQQISPLTDRSIYQVESTWTTDSSQALHLADLRGKPQVLAMFFTHCQFACPILVHDMQQIETALPESLRADVGFTLVSFDTERDTPEILAAYRQGHSLAPDRWTLLRGKPDDVLELADVLNVKFKKDARGQFAHSNVITLLNSEGEIVQQQIGLGQSGQEFVKAIEQLALSARATKSMDHRNPTTTSKPQVLDRLTVRSSADQPETYP